MRREWNVSASFGARRSYGGSRRSRVVINARAWELYMTDGDGAAAA